MWARWSDGEARRTSGPCRDRRRRRRHGADRQRPQCRRPSHPGSARLADRRRKSDRGIVPAAVASSAGGNVAMSKPSPQATPRAITASRNVVCAAGALCIRLFALAPLDPLLSSLSGCKPVGPNYNRPGYSAPAAYKETGATAVVVPPPNPQGGAWQPANPSDGMLKGKWWEIYQDPQLNQLEERIDTNNVQLRQAHGDLPGRARPGARRARQSLSHALRRPFHQPRSRFGQPSSRHAGQHHHLRRLRHRRPGQLGAGLLGPHSPHRRSRPAPTRRPAPPTRPMWISPFMPRWPPTTFALRGLDSQIQLLDRHGRRSRTPARPDPAALCRRRGHRGGRGAGANAA